MSRDEFWSLTIRDLFREFVAAKQRRDDLQDVAIGHAWHVALFSRQEKLPSLQRVLTSMHGRRPQTIAQQRTVMDMLSAKLGVPVKRARFIRKDAA